MQNITSKIRASLQPRRQAIERDQFLGAHARPHQRPFASFDKDFRDQGAGIVSSRLNRAVSAGGHDGEKIARFRLDHGPIERKEIA